jgi:hypothetical protein
MGKKYEAFVGADLCKTPLSTVAQIIIQMMYQILRLRDVGHQ